MRELTRARFARIRSGVVTAIVIAASGLFCFPSETRDGFGFTRGNQDPYAQPPFVSLNPDNLDFGDQVVRRTSAPRRITVKNTGGKPLYIESVDLGGDNRNSFAMIKDTCTGATIDPDRACIIDVTFTPTRTGGRNARLRMNNNAPTSPQRLRLKGNGINSSAVPPF